LQLWVVKATGEVYASYEAYLNKAKLYDELVWSCKFTGRGGLTLEDAQASEHKALAALKQVRAAVDIPIFPEGAAQAPASNLYN
jgi:hypothetical protein